MNLSEEHRAPIRRRDVAQKRDMLVSFVRRSAQMQVCLGNDSGGLFVLLVFVGFYLFFI